MVFGIKEARSFWRIFLLWRQLIYSILNSQLLFQYAIVCGPLTPSMCKKSSNTTGKNDFSCPIKACRILTERSKTIPITIDVIWTSLWVENYWQAWYSPTYILLDKLLWKETISLDVSLTNPDHHPNLRVGYTMYYKQLSSAPNLTTNLRM